MNYLLKLLLSITILLLTRSFSLALTGNLITIWMEDLENIYQLNTPNDPITATIEGNNSFCLNTPNAKIIFRGTGGIKPRTFYYQIDSGPEQTIISSNNNDTVQIPVNTSIAKSFNYKIIKIKDNSGNEDTVDVSKTIIVNELPVLDFTFTNNNSCSGTPIQFTSTVSGAGPYTYSWDFGDLSNSNEKNPSHIFKAFGTGTQTFNVKLIVTDNTTSCQNSVSYPVNIKKGPDASLDINMTNGATQYDPIQKMFINCSATKTSPQFEFIAVNASSTSAINTGYRIDWGDGSQPEDLPKSFLKLLHTYTELGFFDISITGINTVGECTSATTIYKFFNGNTPGGNLENISNTADCVPFTVTWPVVGTQDNTPGTTYIFSVDDGSSPQTFTQSTLTDSISHTFTKSSCDKEIGKFTIKFKITNPCDSSEPTIQVQATQKPIAKISVNPGLSVCLNNITTFTNASNGNYSLGDKCYTQFNKTWTISPNNGWNLTSGSLIGTEVIKINFNTTGDYSVKLKIQSSGSTTSSRCNSDSTTQIIHVNPLPTATISGNATVCQNSNPLPFITFTGANGIAPYTFKYTINGTAKTIKTTNGDTVSVSVPTDKAGTFTYTLVSVQEGSAGCSQPQSGTAVIVVNPAPNATISGTKNVCLNDTPPNITFTGSNGTPPYTFTYNINGGTNQTITTTTGNSVTVAVPTDALSVYKYNLVGVQDAGTSSCSQSTTSFATITINQPPEKMTLTNQEFCNGVKTPVISFSNPVPNTTYSWNNSNTAIGLNSSGTGNIPAFTAKNNTANPITATITVVPAAANNCFGESQTFTITINPAASVTFSLADQTTCSGESSKEVLLSSPTTGAALSWTTTQPSGIAETIQLSGTNSIPAQILTNTSSSPVTIFYKASAILSGTTTCAGTEYTYKITVNPKPVVFGGIKDTICSGTTFSYSPPNGGENTIPTGTKYTWSEPAVNPIGSLTGGGAQNTPQSLISQTLVNTTVAMATIVYSISPVFNGCIGVPFEVIVYVSPMPVANPVNDITLCDGYTNGEIIFDGYPAGTEFEWSTDNQYIGINGTSGKNKIPYFTATNNGTSPITTTINVTPVYVDKNPDCESKSVQFSITVNPTGQVNNPGHIYACNKQSTSIKFSTENTGGTSTYSWTNSNTNLGLAASGKNDIQFIPINNGNTEMSSIITVIPTYTNNGYSCEGEAEQFTITVDPIVISLIDKTDLKCFGESTGAVTVNVKGGKLIELYPNVFDYKYLWKGLNGFTNTFRDLINVPAGKYDLTVTDDSGCNQPFSIEIKEPAPISITAKTAPISCYGANDASIQLTISGDFPPFLAQWDNFASGTFQENLSAGDYSISVTDANNCKKTIDVNIPEASAFRLNPEVKNVSCYGAKDGRIDLNYEGGADSIAFSWSDNSTSGTTRNNIGPGTYTVNIGGGNVCQFNKTFVITEPLPLELTSEVINDFDCEVENGGAIKLITTGGTPPYSYNWSNGSKTKDISNLYPGTYAVTVTDSIGCTKTEQYNISRPSPIDININTKTVYDCADQKPIKKCTALINGGVPPYQMNWSAGKISGDNNEIMETDHNGTYSLTVTDAMGCPAQYSFSIIISELGIKNQLLDCNLRAFQFNALVLDEFENYSYSWDFGDGAISNEKNPKHTYSEAGSYKVKLNITDNTYTCTSSYEQIVDIEKITVLTDKDTKFCIGDTIFLYALGAENYKWNDGTTGDSLLIIHPGEYSVIGYSNDGCTDTLRFTASYYNLINYTIQSDKDDVTPEQNQVHLWSEDVPFSKYYWEFGDGTYGQGYDIFHNFDIATDGFFDVKLNVINPFGCLEEAVKRIGIGISSVPNTITPNGDGINDVYLRGWHIQIYNRNGILIYEGKDGWDGTYKGKPVASDTYFVVIYDSAETGAKYKTDYITVIRE